MDILRKIIKPIATGAVILIGLGILGLIGEPKMNFEFSNLEPDIHSKDKNEANDESNKIVLHAKELEQLRWMSVSQLEAIFNGRRGQFVVESSQAAYNQLRWMSTSQLRAIFGSKDIPGDE